MKEYIHQNATKLKWTFMMTSAALTIGFLIWIFCSGLEGFTAPGIVFGLLLTMIILPALVTSSEALYGMIEYKRTESFFESRTMREWLGQGFTKEWDSRDSRWYLSKRIAVGRFDQFEMICEVEDGRLRVIAKADYGHLDSWTDQDIKSVQQAFGHVRFEYDGQGIATSLKVSAVREMTLSAFEAYLREFGKMLRQLKIG